MTQACQNLRLQELAKKEEIYGRIQNISGNRLVDEIDYENDNYFRHYA